METPYKSFYAGFRHATPGFIWVVALAGKRYRDEFLERNQRSFPLRANDPACVAARKKGLRQAWSSARREYATLVSVGKRYWEPIGGVLP